MQANESTPKPEQTFGEKRVRASFNPSRESAVDLLKGRTADLIDQMKRMQDGSEDPEVKRQCAQAMTEYESACHLAVKAATAGK